MSGSIGPDELMQLAGIIKPSHGASAAAAVALASAYMALVMAQKNRPLCPHIDAASTAIIAALHDLSVEAAQGSEDWATVVRDVCRSVMHPRSDQSSRN